MDDATHPALVALAAAADAVAAAREALLGEGWSLSDAELRASVVDAVGLRSMADSLYLAAVAGLDAHPEAVEGVRASGRTAARFLTAACRVNGVQAGRDVAAARTLTPGRAGADWAADLTTGAGQSSRSLPGFAAALAVGEVSKDHVHAAVACLRRIPLAVLEQPAVTDATRTGADVLEELLLDTSRRHCPRDVDDLAAQLHARLQARPERDPGEAFLRRGVSLLTDATGMVLVRGQLDPATGAAVKAVVDFHAAPAPVTADGEVPVPDPRTPAQRTADAFGVIARLAAAASGTRGMDPPLVLVTATLEQVAAARSAGARHVAMAPTGLAACAQTGLLAPAWLDVLSCDATVQRATISATGEVLHLGSTVRLATRAQRRALAARDGARCLVPGCRAPVGALDAHHIRSWQDHGPTDVPNLVLLCGRHHTETHLGLLELVVLQGLPYVRPPTWVDPDRRPLRPTHHDVARRAAALADQLRLTLEPPDDDPPDTS